MPNRFDYVAYDEIAQAKQTAFKNKFQEIEKLIEALLADGRAKSLTMTKLEEAYVWIGKSIRDDQITRNGSAPLQEARTNS